MATVKGSDLLVKALENEGVTHVFGVPGEENLDFVESLRNSSIKLVITRHEQPAAFMAATYGRLTGRPGVCLSTLGPGALNLVTGAAYALLGAMPMILITGQKPILSSRQARFQIVDIVNTMRPLTKLSRQIVSAASIPATVREAFRVTREERPGPVHLELPEDIAREMTEHDAVIPPHEIPLPVASEASLARAAAMIVAAKRPLIMLGAGANRVALADALSAFVKRTNIPFFNTQMGKGAVTGCSELYVGTAALSERDYIHRMIDRSDLIIAIGHDTVEKPPFLMQPEQHVIHVGFMPATVERVYFPDSEIIGDVGPGLLRLAELVAGRLKQDPAFVALKDEVIAHVSDRATESRFPL
ncbi:MAG TPA: thiamine pyrophosphate-binding protein, partial [Acidocella sp.]|nr:thiamine pyrophosphate-binding protein [Acidocella sp.]